MLHNWTIKLGLLVTLVFSAQVSALNMRLSQSDVNQMVKMAFPQTHQYQGIDMVFSDPSLGLGTANQVNVTLTIRGRQQQQFATVRASLTGQLNYDKAGRSLQIIRPELTDFEVIEKQLTQGSELLDSIKSLQHQPAPFILLLDFNKIQLPLLGNQVPSDIAIEDHHLVVRF